MFLPVRLLESLGQIFGGQEFPDSPIFLYALRVVSATYVVMGVFFVMLALRPVDYGAMVPFSGIALVFLAVVCGITGQAAEMPLLWFLGDSLSCAVLGVLILLFRGQAKQTSQPSSDAE